MSDEKRADSFVLAEYAALREEIKWIIGQVESLERNALLFSGAIWAWIAPQQWKPFYVVVVWLPLLLSILFLIKRESLRRSLKEAANFSLKVESYFNVADDVGWDHYLKFKGVRYFKFWKAAFWTVLILFNLGMALAAISLSQ